MGRIRLRIRGRRHPGGIRRTWQDHCSLSPFAGTTQLLEQIAADRINGVVVQNSGYEPGVAGVAAPIRDVTDRIVAAINVSAVAMLLSEAELNRTAER